LRVAVIGLGNRGRGMAEWQFPPYMDVVAICDVDLRKTGRVAEAIQRRTGREVDVCQDYRRLLDRRDIHAIGNATCEHWHTKINTEACRAGKDVYAEKPLALTIDEGKVLRRVVEQTGRVVQVGTQQRSGPQFQIACSLVRNGRIGKLRQVAVIIPSRTGAHGPQCTPAPVPQELDWDVWSGQAPLHPFSEPRLTYRNWSDYGGGFVTDWGAHHMDIAHWGMGGKELGPLSVEATGYSPNFGKPGYPDQFEPFVARLEYPGDVELWFFTARAAGTPKADPTSETPPKVVQDIYGRLPDELRDYQAPDPDGGTLFIGEQGTVFVGRGLVVGQGIGELEMMPIAENRTIVWRSCLYAHTYDFVRCVRSRSQPISNVPEQHRSLIPCHLTNLSLRLGRKLRWDSEREEFLGDDEANQRLKRTQRAPYQIEG
jgi:predicted dehydrogenase